MELFHPYKWPKINGFPWSEITLVSGVMGVPTYNWFLGPRILGALLTSKLPSLRTPRGVACLKSLLDRLQIDGCKAHDHLKARVVTKGLKSGQLHKQILLMEKILHQLIGSLSHVLQGFIHVRWCRISSINSMFLPILSIPRDPITYSENGFMEPKYLAFMHPLLII